MNKKTASARERVRAERERDRRRQQTRKTLAIIVGATLFIVVVIGGGWWLMNRGSGFEFGGELAEQSLQDDGSVVMGDQGASLPVVEVYADFQCPICKDFEDANAETLNELAGEGEAIVHMRPVSIFALQGEPIANNSLRAAAAARAAADYGVYVQYSDLLWENQPTEGSEGYASQDLQDWGGEAGIEEDDLEDFNARIDEESAAVEEFVAYSSGLVSAAQTVLSDDELRSLSVGELMDWGEESGAVDAPDLDGTYVRQILDATTAVDERYSDGENEFTGTPSIYVNGELLDLRQQAMTRDDLRDAVVGASPGDVDTSPVESVP